MGEFVGMDPGAVRRLASALRDTGGLAAQLKPILAESIDLAGSDFPGGPGTVVLDRLRRFTDRTADDIEWRVRTLERLERGVGLTGFLSGELPFPSMDAAKQAGIVAGAEGRRLWEAYRRDPSGPNRAALLRWSHGLGNAKTKDGAYAAALLRTLGRENLTALITENTKGGAGKLGLTQGELEGVRDHLGPIAEAVASAEAAEALPSDIREAVLNDLPDAGLSALLALADQPTSLLVPAARRLIPAGHGSEPNWNTHWMVTALARNPEAMRQVVSDQHDLALLLHPRVTKWTGTPGFEAQLAKALDGVTAPGMGTSEERREIFINTMKLLATAEYRPSLADGSPLNAVLAKNSGQYFPQLAGIAAAANESAPQFHPGGPWHEISPDTARRFMAAVMQDPDTAPTLREQFRKYAQGIDLSDAHPYGDDDERENFEKISANAGGLGGLLLDGVASADLNAEQRREAVAELAMLPVDFLVGKAVAGNPIGDAAAGGAVLDPAKDFALTYLDQNEEEATRYAGQLIDLQIMGIDQELQEHGGESLGETDRRRLRNEVQGQYFESMLRGLKARGG